MLPQIQANKVLQVLENILYADTEQIKIRVAHEVRFGSTRNGTHDLWIMATTYLSHMVKANLR